MGHYVLQYDIHYYSPRYKKSVLVPKGYESDGASGPAIDIYTEAWWIHDKLCEDGKWFDGSPCTDWQASTVLSDVLKRDGFKFRSWYWKWATFFYGCIRARKGDQGSVW